MGENEPQPGEIDEHGFCKYCRHEAPECMCSVLSEWGKQPHPDLKDGDGD